MGRFGGKRPRRARDFSPYPALQERFVEAVARRDEEAVRGLLRVVEGRFIAPWPDLVAVWVVVDALEDEATLEALLQEAERRVYGRQKQ